MKKIFFNLTILASFLTFSCAKKEKKPNGILADSTMRNLIIEFTLAEAGAELSLNKQEIPDFKSELFYESTLKKSSISRDSFIKSLNYYSENPDQLNKIYEDAITELSKRQMKR